MRNIGAISLLLILSSWIVPNGERLYDKLERKYEKDPLKCLEYATKMKQKRLKDPEIYYFLAKMSVEKFDTNVLLTKRYSALNRAASEAYRMNKYVGKSAYLKPEAEKLSDTIAATVKSYRDTFLRLEDHDHADRMVFHYKRLTGITLPSLEEIKEAKLAALRVPKIIDGLYFGLPSGEENIPSYSEERERELLAILNKARVAKGMGELVWDEDLARAARYHANDMATQNYFTHSTRDRVDGKEVVIGGAFQRIGKFYHGPGYANSENIAAGGSTASYTYYQWDTSKGHHENMFNKYSKRVGLGIAYNPKSSYKYYWVFCTAI